MPLCLLDKVKVPFSSSRQLQRGVSGVHGRDAVAHVEGGGEQD